MKRRKFIATAAAGSLATTSSAMNLDKTNKEKTQQILEFRRYTFRFGANQQLLHDYLKDVYIPALNRQGINSVGAFMELGLAEPAKLYLLTPFNSMAQMGELEQKLMEDFTYQQMAKSYHTIPQEYRIYTRFDTWLMRAFKNMPQVSAPETSERIFELRTYEGYSEDAVRRKVMMFNDEELALFYKLKLTPVFFGHLLSGPAMPALAYMLTFKDMEERDQRWNTFFQHPEWNRMKVLPKYVNTVSNIIKVFLKPTDYSQI